MRTIQSPKDDFRLIERSYENIPASNEVKKIYSWGSLHKRDFQAYRKLLKDKFSLIAELLADGPFLITNNVNIIL